MWLFWCFETYHIWSSPDRLSRLHCCRRCGSCLCCSDDHINMVDNSQVTKWWWWSWWLWWLWWWFSNALINMVSNTQVTNCTSMLFVQHSPECLWFRWFYWRNSFFLLLSSTQAPPSWGAVGHSKASVAAKWENPWQRPACSIQQHQQQQWRKSDKRSDGQDDDG